MPQQTLDISIEDQVDFFLPLFITYTEKLKIAFSESRNSDYSEAEWILIFSNTKSGPLLKHHSLTESWEDIGLFLQGKTKLLCFIEEKAKGLVQNKYMFWTFSTPNTAAEYFKHQLSVPKEFKAQSIISLPFLKLLDPIIERITKTLNDDKMSQIDVVKKIFDTLQLAEWYLGVQDMEKLNNMVKKSIISFTLTETGSLLDDIYNPGYSPVLLKKRLKGIFKIGWKYFRAKNELETAYFKKLLSENTEDHAKGLKLTKKKVLDFKERLS